jgi:hypothetical protein
VRERIEYRFRVPNQQFLEYRLVSYFDVSSRRACFFQIKLCSDKKKPMPITVTWRLQGDKHRGYITRGTGSRLPLIRRVPGPNPSTSIFHIYCSPLLREKLATNAGPPLDTFPPASLLNAVAAGPGCCMPLHMVTNVLLDHVH